MKNTCKLLSLYFLNKNQLSEAVRLLSHTVCLVLGFFFISSVTVFGSHLFWTKLKQEVLRSSKCQAMQMKCKGSNRISTYVCPERKVAETKIINLRYLRYQSINTTIQIIDKKLKYCACLWGNIGLVKEVYKLKQFWQKKKLLQIGQE